MESCAQDNAAGAGREGCLRECGGEGEGVVTPGHGDGEVVETEIPAFAGMTWWRGEAAGWRATVPGALTHPPASPVPSPVAREGWATAKRKGRPEAPLNA